MNPVFSKWTSVILCAITSPLAIAQTTAPSKPPLAAVKPVIDDYFGIKLTDPYRYMENLDDSQVQSWMKAQADYTTATLDRLPGRAALLAEIDKYVNAAPASVREVRRLAGGKYFFIKTLADQSIGKLYMRQNLDGKDTLLIDTEKFTGPNGEPAAINYYEPSPDGRYIAYGVSQGGSEAATLRIFDVQANKDLPESMDREEFGGLAWSTDSKSLFYNRLQKLAADQSPEDKYRDSKIFLHHLGDSPDKDVAVFGNGLSAAVKFLPDDNPFVETQVGSDYAIGIIGHGVQNEQTIYVAPLAAMGKGDIPWIKLCDVDAGVTDFAFIGDDIYLHTHKDASRFQILRASLKQPDPAHFQTFLPQLDGVMENLTVAADALYVTELDNGINHVVRAPFDGKPARIDLPFDGSTEVYSGDPRVPGIVFTMDSWTKGPRILEFDPQSSKVNPTNLRPPGPYDNLDELVSEEVQAPSYDGTNVPLSIMHKRGVKLDGSNPTILWAYGAYGITEDAGFNSADLAWLERGGVFAVGHVRGGGERGEDWHLAGYKLTKPNTWRDMIACAQYLIDQKYTSPPKLGIMGGSAGGIIVGRAMTERPDLFAAAVPLVGCLNTLRAEFSPNGPPNIPEFGSVKTQEGFEDLYAMDAYEHIRDGVAYPATLITTGLNDPRVATWIPLKFAARLQPATSSGKPVLLRIDYQGGHGIGASKRQRIEEYADEYAFLLWQFGDSGFQPKP